MEKIDENDFDLSSISCVRK